MFQKIKLPPKRSWMNIESKSFETFDNNDDWNGVKFNRNIGAFVWNNDNEHNMFTLNEKKKVDHDLVPNVWGNYKSNYNPFKNDLEYPRTKVKVKRKKRKVRTFVPILNDKDDDMKMGTNTETETDKPRYVVSTNQNNTLRTSILERIELGKNRKYCRYTIKNISSEYQISIRFLRGIIACVIDRTLRNKVVGSINDMPIFDTFKQYEFFDFSMFLETKKKPQTYTVETRGLYSDHFENMVLPYFQNSKLFKTTKREVFSCGSHSFKMKITSPKFLKLIKEKEDAAKFIFLINKYNAENGVNLGNSATVYSNIIKSRIKEIGIFNFYRFWDIGHEDNNFVVTIYFNIRLDMENAYMKFCKYVSDKKKNKENNDELFLDHITN